MKSLFKIAALPIVGGLGLVGLVGIALAQSPEGAPPASPALAELQKEVQVAQLRVNEDFRHVLHLQQLARRDKDVIKLNCVNDKLVQLKAQMNIFDLAKKALDSSGDSDDRTRMMSDVNEPNQNIRKLREEADQCIGETALSTESQSGFTGPTAPDSPYGEPFDPNFEPPAYASPFN